MKIEKKFDNWIWFFIRIFPFIYVLFFVIGLNGTLLGEGVFDLSIYVSLWEMIIQEIAFIPVYIPLFEVFTIMLGETIPIFISGMLSYVSYLVFIELLRFLCIFFTFLFKLIRNWIEGWV